MKLRQRIHFLMKEEFMQCMTDYLVPWFIKTAILLVLLILFVMFVVLLKTGIHSWADIHGMIRQCLILSLCGMLASAFAFWRCCKKQYKRPSKKGSHTLKEELNEKK